MKNSGRPTQQAKTPCDSNAPRTRRYQVRRNVQNVYCESTRHVSPVDERGRQLSKRKVVSCSRSRDASDRYWQAPYIRYMSRKIQPNGTVPG